MLLVAGVVCAGQNYTVSVPQLKIPDKARAAYEKAEAAFNKNDIGQAQQQIDKALQLSPHYAQALILRGIVELTQLRPEKARESLEPAVQYDANDALAYIALGATYNALGRFDDALRMLDRGMPLMPNNWQAHFETAKALLGKRQYQASLREVDKAEGLAPVSFAPALRLVRAHALAGVRSYAQAATELQQYLAEQPDGPGAREARETLEQLRTATANSR
jgi:tetratricopeptide (TPR) repeat protein